ncbi:hypothetical protein [Corynebacterium coyleae]|uniref:hypothetical protein n=1 Tax=Corynebacterium coyleae TaxID=53374 RepID=UPI00254A783E|nr:hypothetical protein [Corynebacterium coyleae]MDK8242137.1 hypothetical protein [Corynebacterium coyleae]
MSFDYDRLKELADEHTPGPWVRHPDQPRALCNLDTKFLVHHEMVTSRGMVTSAEDMANTELIALAPVMARELLRLRDEIQATRDRVADELERTPEELKAARITLYAEREHFLSFCDHLLNGDTK